MKKTIILTLLSILFSCERHSQTSTIPPEVEAKVADLNVIESLIVTILTDNITDLKNILDENPNIDLNAQNERGQVILNEAVRYDRIFIGRVLLERGADPEISDIDGETALTFIEKSELKEQWHNLLADEPLSVEFLTDLIFTTLSETAKDEQQMTITKLSLYFDNGAPFDGQDETGYSYLMFAANNDLADVAAHLCSYDETDPFYTLIIIRRRREYRYTAMNYAKTPEMKAVLNNCGLKRR